MLKDLVANLGAGLRSALGLHLATVAWRPRVSSYVGILVLITLLTGWVDYSQPGGDPRFNPFGVVGFSALLFVALLTAVVVSAAQSAYQHLPTLLTASASIFFWYLVFYFTVTRYLAPLLFVDSGWLRVLFLVLAMLLGVVAVRTSFYRPLVRSGALAACSVVLLYWLVSEWYVSTDFFYSYTDEDYERYYNVDPEAVYYRQNHLVGEKIKALAPADPSEAEAYFVGFAGDGDEAIFASEVQYAKQVMDEKFLSAGRSLYLASSFPDIGEEPLANIYNLDAVLQAVAANMNVADDILFLFLTSHGSRDGSIEVSLAPFQMQSLNAPRLRRSLDDAGIQWRVIIISACYSGSFVDALRNDNTVIVTAASAEKASFGCSIDRELTYFGEALFRDALAQESDFLKAVEMARRSVSAREREEGLEPSEPQLIVGAGMLRKLRALGITAH